MESSNAELRAFVGPRADYYLARWADPKRTFGFNWAACLFTLAWLLYRRMYRVFWIFLGVVACETFASQFVAIYYFGLEETSRTYDTLVNFLAAATAGTFGNLWYYRHAQRQLVAAKAAGAVTPEELAPAGGVRWWPVLILLAIGTAAVLLVVLLPAE